MPVEPQRKDEQQPSLLRAGGGAFARGLEGNPVVDARAAVAEECGLQFAHAVALQPIRHGRAEALLAARADRGGPRVGVSTAQHKFVSLAVDELLRRPETLAEAQASALKNDIDAVRHYAWEAVRFNPHHPLLVRYCGRTTTIAGSQPRSRTVPAASKVYVATFSAMFDPEAFTKPAEFNPKRQTEYLHFGYGMHTCFGSAINGIQIPELLAALLRLPHLRRAPGSAGQILYDGPFPNRLILEFDA